jgi:uncharacterized protein
VTSRVSEWHSASVGWFANQANSFDRIRQASHLLYPGNTLFHRRRMRLWLRSIVWWKATSRWLKHCETSPLLELAQRLPIILERPHRPFLHGRFNLRARVAVSLDHHAFTMQRAPHLAQRIAVEGQVPIARLVVGDEYWNVSLESIAQFQKEGDWSLCLRDRFNQRVVSCTFSFAYLGSKRPRLCIGAVQGPDSSLNGLELFRTLTKRWHGLRPKMIAIYLAQCVAAELGAHGTLIISTRAHIYTNWRYWLRKRRVEADYDNLARECGAHAQWNGWSVVTPPQRYLAQQHASTTGTAPRRRRHALRLSLAAQIHANIAP